MRIILEAFIIIIATFLLHEAAHFLAGKVLGYSMWVSINHAAPTSGAFTHDLHRIIVNMAGPAITLLQAIIAFIIGMQKNSKFAFLVVFLCFYHRLTATVISLSKPNDEMRASLDLNLDAWTLPLLVTGLLMIMVILLANRTRPGWKTVALAWVGGSLAFTVVVFGEPLLPRIVW